MKHNEFKIGVEFAHRSKHYICTDVGTRIVAAVCITICRENDWGRCFPENILDEAWENDDQKIDPSHIKGPPYALAESVFTEERQSECRSL